MLKPYPITWLNSLRREYMQRKRKSRKGGSYSTLSLLRKELREGNLQSLFGGSPCIVSSSNAAADPLLSSFILPVANEPTSSQPHLHTETRSSKKCSDDTVSRRYFLSFFNFFKKMLFPLHGILLNLVQVFLNELMMRYCAFLLFFMQKHNRLFLHILNVSEIG